MQTVFIVEDSQPVLERLRRMISGIPGTAVVGHAGRADEAISEILFHKPDVVVLDLYLDNSSGFDVLRALRARAPATVVYMLSNFASAPYRKFAIELGASAFFDKSSEFERVREAIAKRVNAVQ